MDYIWEVISGIIISVIGLLVGTFLFSPIRDLKEALGKLNSLLVFRYNVLGNPGTVNESISTTTSEELRSHASLLLANANRVHWYKCFEMFNLMPKRDNIYEAHQLLLGISNSVTKEDKKDNREDIKKVTELLNLKLRI